MGQKLEDERTADLVRCVADADVKIRQGWDLAKIAQGDFQLALHWSAIVSHKKRGRETSSDQRGSNTAERSYEVQGVETHANGHVYDDDYGPATTHGASSSTTTMLSPPPALTFPVRVS